MRKVSEVGFLLELALPLELEQLSRAFLRLYHDRHERQRNETFLLRIFVHEALQGRRQCVGSVVINLKGFNGHRRTLMTETHINIIAQIRSHRTRISVVVIYFLQRFHRRAIFQFP